MSSASASCGPERPEKNWKFSLSDLEERRYWDDYQDAFESMMRNTSTSYALGIACR